MIRKREEKEKKVEKEKKEERGEEGGGSVATQPPLPFIMQRLPASCTAAALKKVSSVVEGKPLRRLYHTIAPSPIPSWAEPLQPRVPGTRVLLRRPPGGPSLRDLFLRPFRGAAVEASAESGAYFEKIWSSTVVQ